MTGTGLGYDLAVGIGAAVCALLCAAARRRPGRWTTWVLVALGALLLADSLVWQLAPVLGGTWSVRDYLPLDLCDMADLVAVVVCWTQWAQAGEVLYFWAVAGTVQGILTPNLTSGFPHLEFLVYVVEHMGVVTVALFMVVGLRRYPRAGAVGRIVAITAAYTALVGAVDAATGSDYMFLAARPATWSLLTVLGPWPWYVLSATGVAVALFTLLDAPFWAGRRRERGRPAARRATVSGAV